MDNIYELNKQGLTTSLTIKDHDYDVVEFTLEKNLVDENGKVIVDDCTLDELDVYTSNGEINVTMAGSQANYHIEMTTSNGSKYLNDLEIAANSINSSQSKEVSLRTSNGPIRLTFAND